MKPFLEYVALNHLFFLYFVDVSQFTMSPAVTHAMSSQQQKKIVGKIARHNVFSFVLSTLETV